METNKDIATEEIVLDDKQLVCALTKRTKTASEKEVTLQSMIMMLNEEYNFDLKDMERDFSFSYPPVFGIPRCGA
jgi:type I restriction enzyme M protein